jgi:hypothetical protein
VSNIGVVDGDVSSQEGGEKSAWCCERAAFVIGGEVTGAVFNIGVVSVKGKGLEIAVSWQNCAVKSGLGEQL